jgi:hypothetical protein
METIIKPQPMTCKIRDYNPDEEMGWLHYLECKEAVLHLKLTLDKNTDLVSDTGKRYIEIEKAIDLVTDSFTDVSNPGDHLKWKK